MGNADLQIVHLTDVDRKWYIIPWNSNIKKVWDILGLVFIVYLTFQIPFSLTFLNYQEMTGILTITEIFFVLDLVLNFFTGYIKRGDHIVSLNLIAMHYLKTWFLIDFVACVPWERLLTLRFSNEQVSSVVILRWAKLPKLVRVFRLFKTLQRYVRYYNVTLLTVILIFISHFGTCIWINIFQICSLDSYTCCKTSYILRVYLLGYYANFTSMFIGQTYFLQQFPQPLQTISVLLNFTHLSSCDSSNTLNISAWKSFDYTNITITSASQRYSYDFFSKLVGILLASLILVEIFILMNMKAEARLKQQNSIDLFKQQLKQIEAPHSLKYRIRRYYDYLLMHQNKEKTTLLLDPSLSNSLRQELAYAIFSKIILRVEVFKSCSSDAIYALALRLQTRIYLPDQLIFKKGDITKSMFIIDRGWVSVWLLENQESNKNNPSLNETETQVVFEEETVFDETQPSNNKKTVAEKILSRENASRKFSNWNKKLSKKVDPLLFPNLSSTHSTESSANEWDSKKKLGPGEYFGELCLLTKNPRAKTVTSITLSELHELSQSSYAEVMLQFPTIHERILEKALQIYPFLTKSMLNYNSRNIEQTVQNLMQNIEHLQKLLKNKGR